MFKGSSSLTNLNLSSFDTSSTIQTISMFQDYTNLNTIYVGDKWDTNGAVAIDMFSGCGTQSVTHI